LFSNNKLFVYIAYVKELGMLFLEAIKVDIGKKIKRLRLENSLTQEELANRSELSKGFISQLERDMTSPSIATLVDILECLGTDLNEFFSDAVDEKIVFTKEDLFETQDAELGYKLEWIVPNAQKNMMEPIILNIEPNGSYIEDNPHQGEEFGHVLEGSVIVQLGTKKYKAKKGESFYYKTNFTHNLYNVGNKKAKVLMVGAPPNF
jgi:transcriptional regulator with XRE-family HTH domain